MTLQVVLEASKTRRRKKKEEEEEEEEKKKWEGWLVEWFAPRSV